MLKVSLSRETSPVLFRYLQRTIPNHQQQQQLSEFRKLGKVGNPITSFLHLIKHILRENFTFYHYSPKEGIYFVFCVNLFINLWNCGIFECMLAGSKHGVDIVK